MSDFSERLAERLGMSALTANWVEPPEAVDFGFSPVETIVTAWQAAHLTTGPATVHWSGHGLPKYESAAPATRQIQWHQYTTDFFILDDSTFVVELKGADFAAATHFLALDESQHTPYFIALEQSENQNPAAVATEQLAFPLGGDFSPSKELTSFWVRGVTAMAGRADPKLAPSAVAATDLEIQQEFARMLISLFGTTAQQLRYETKPDLIISRRSRFELTYQIQLCDQFIIIPDEAQQFLSLLHEELVAALSSGVRITGAWGYVTVNRAGGLEYILAPPRRIVDDSFTRAERVE